TRSSRVGHRARRRERRRSTRPAPGDRPKRTTSSSGMDGNGERRSDRHDVLGRPRRGRRGPRARARAAPARSERACARVGPPDLPVFLWWTGTPPIGSRSFGDLLRLTDRLIVDSADFARPEVTLPTIARISETAHGRFGLTDLNWTRLTPWREIATAFFDVPSWRLFLDGITGLR